MDQRGNFIIYSTRIENKMNPKSGGENSILWMGSGLNITSGYLINHRREIKSKNTNRAFIKK